VETTERRRWVPFVVTLLISAPLAVLLAWPQLFGVQTALVVSQLVAFRMPIALLLLVGAAAFGATALLRRRWGIAAGLAVALAVTSIASGGVVAARGIGGSMPVGDLTVVAWNTLGGAATPESIARFLLDSHADIVSLPEMDEAAVAEVARLLSLEGVKMNAHTTYGETGYSEIPTSVLISAGLGEYGIDASAGSTPDLPSAVLRPVDGAGPTIVAAHPMPPLPFSMGQWRAGLQWVADQCTDANTIVAGDLNATLDHLAGLGVNGGTVGECRDAARETGAAGVGTWPISAPTWLGAPIDHVLVGSAWKVRGFEVVTSVDDAGSDHRPVVAVLDAR
jgi:endonuclease/exonuclease/phosphatase (EEP) superfamily protein YafD